MRYYGEGKSDQELTLSYKPQGANGLMIIEIMIGLFLICLLVIVLLVYMLSMPGKSYQGNLPNLSLSQVAITKTLQAHVEYLSQTLGPRNVVLYHNLLAAKNYIEKIFENLGYEIHRQIYQVNGKEFCNIETRIIGEALPNEIIVIGAHYDTVPGSAGADDNASGVAVLLELANILKNIKTKRSVYLVAFVNEEYPYFYRREMGSYVYASALKKQHANVVAMFSLESLGYYSDQKNSQKYPAFLKLFYSDQGNFVAFVGNMFSRSLVRKAIKLFRENAQFPSEGIAAPVLIPGIGWSDQINFWHFGYPAVMVTDTVPFRNPYYHTAQDTPETLDYENITRVMDGLSSVIINIINE